MSTGKDNQQRMPVEARAGMICAIIWEWLCRMLAGLHLTVARVLTRLIGFLWRIQARLPRSLRFCAAFLVLGGVALATSRLVPDRFVRLAGFVPQQVRLLDRFGLWTDAQWISAGAMGVAVLCFLASGAAWLRRPWVLWVMKAAWAAWIILWLRSMQWMLDVPATLYREDFRVFDRTARNALWTLVLGGGLPALFIPVLTLLALARVRTRRFYHDFRCTARTLAGDRILSSLTSGGGDPQYRSSLYWAIALFMMILIGPFLVRGCGREDPYGLIKGSGEAQIQVVRVTRTREKPKKRLVVNAWSPYIFERIDIDETRVLDELVEQTLDTYQAEVESAGGALGAGGGKTGGWPEGMEHAVVRFIRLRYRGGDWDRDMGKGGDYNLLIRFREITGFPIAHETESRDIERLRMFPAGKAPPFVFMTGQGNIQVSEREVQVLRWYLEQEGGMLFIDNGGGHFDRSVRSLLARVLPGRPLVDIPNDDPIFREPFVFPDGAPPLWHHAGRRALGVSMGGRWAVFYHPGDMNDAWKDGHSGASPAVVDQAYKLGVNVIFHAFNTYYRKHYGR